MKPATVALINAEFSTPNDPSSTALRGATVKEKNMFAIRDLSVLAYANGFTLWHYKAGNASLAEVGARDFFHDVADMVAVGDIMLVSAKDGGAALCFSAADAHGIATTPVNAAVLAPAA